MWRVELRVWKRRRSEGVQYEHLNAMLALASSTSPSARADLPRGMAARRRYGKLVVGPEAVLPDTADAELECEKAGAEDAADCGRGNTFFINSNSIVGELLVRSRQPGDAISLVGRAGTKTLKKLFIDEKIPRHLRESIPVIADDLGVVAVSGFGIDRSRAPAPGGSVLKLTIRSQE